MEEATACGFEGFDVPYHDPFLQLPPQLVTVVHSPLDVWGTRIEIGYNQYIVYGNVEGVLSSFGEYPVAESLDLDRLLWIERNLARV